MTTVLAVLGACLLAAVAVLQLAIAAGVPLGAHVMGGRYPGVLPARLRVVAAVAVVVLGLGAAVLLARAGVIAWNPLPPGWLVPATWLLAGLMIVNTVGNLAARSKLERYGFGTATAVLSVVTVIVAATGSGAR